MKKFKYHIASTLTVLTLIASFASNAFACACCAEPGTYFLSTGKPSEYALSVVKQFEFANKADLYMTEAGFDMIKGLDPIHAELENDNSAFMDDFDLVSAFTGQAWTFKIKTPNKGTQGTLTLPVPTQMVTFKVDIHDQEDRPNGPLLYKEFRFKGKFTNASGFTKKGVAPGTTYFLVFQGRGNGCDEVENFTNWRLEIDGPRAKYAFYGKLASGEKE